MRRTVFGLRDGWTDQVQALYSCGQPPTIACSGDRTSVVVYGGPGPDDAGSPLDTLFDCHP